jgi:hypothetical protein
MSKACISNLEVGILKFFPVELSTDVPLVYVNMQEVQTECKSIRFHSHCGLLDSTPRSFVGIYENFGGLHCHQFQG